MSSIVEGTNNLSMQVRSQQFYDDLILTNNKLKRITMLGWRWWTSFWTTRT